MRYLIILTLFLVSCNSNNNSKKTSFQTADSTIKSDWTFEKVQGSELVFKSNQRFETNLFELEYIGQIPVENKAPFLIFSGRDCDECDANISIYIHSPDDGQLEVEYGQNRYEYPGTLRDYETDSVLSISRAFYGEVLENIKGFIWYEKVLLENGEFENIVCLFRIENGSIKDSIYADDGKIEQTINLSKRGLCKEIIGRNFKSEP